MANYSALDGYWGLTLKMSGKAPEVAKRIFDTYEHMMYYVNDYNDSCVAGATLKVIADGDNNGVYFVTVIGTNAPVKNEDGSIKVDDKGNPVLSNTFANDGEVVKLGKDSDVSALIAELEAEASAREAAIAELSGHVLDNEVTIAASLTELRTDVDAIAAKIGDVAEDKTVAELIADIEAAAKAAATKLETAEGTAHITVNGVQDETTGSWTYTIGESDIASASATTKAIEDAVAAETTARTEAVNTINEKITTLSSSTSDIQSAITAEAEARAAADSFLSGKVDDNATAIAAVSGSVSSLSSEFDTVKGEVDAFLHAAEVDDEIIDTLKEIQDYIASDESGATEMLNKINANTNAIETLSGHVLDNEVTIAAALTDLNKRIKSADAAISAETEARIAADSTEAEARAAADSFLSGKVDDNATAIAAETTARTEAVNAINEKIGTVAEGKTLVGMIDEAKAAAIAASTVVSGDSDFIEVSVTGEVGKTQTYTIKTKDIASASGVNASFNAVDGKFEAMDNRVAVLEDETITAANENGNVNVVTDENGDTTIGLKWASF